MTKSGKQRDLQFLSRIDGEVNHWFAGVLEGCPLEEQHFNQIIAVVEDVKKEWKLVPNTE